MKHVTVIPSKGRAKYFLKYRDLPILRFKDPIFNTKIWVYDYEEEEYRQTLKDLKINTVEIIVDKISKSIAEKRQKIVEWCYKNNYEYLWMPDDDARFYSYKTGHKPLSMDLQNSLSLFNELSSMCSKEFPLVSPRERFHINGCKYIYEVNHKILVTYFVHVPTFIKEDITFYYKGMKIFEDRVVQLLLHSKGYKTCVTINYSHTQRHQDNSIGGCRDYRTAKESNRCALLLEKDFPGYVKPFYKTDWDIGPRLEARFYFKKFLKEGELHYVPKEEMRKFMDREESYKI